jgi:uncharacterized repeat protein (TIGR03803 family)
MRNRCTHFGTLALAVAVAGCSWPGGTPGGQSAAVIPTTLPLKDSRGYTLLYSFPGGADGIEPLGGLTSVRAVMFGTTVFGGDESACDGGCGTVFAGTKVIYAFKGLSAKDGAVPNGDLILVGKNLYGTTAGGGLKGGICGDNPQAQGCGTVFEIGESGKERVIYRFKGGSDGLDPRDGLVSLNGLLYGTTYFGGTYCGSSSLPGGCGVVFSIDTSGHEKVLHRFNGAPDGAYPRAALLAINGELYGTTAFGGQCQFSNGCGTVFGVTPSGTLSIIYAFKDGTDGADPQTPLISVEGSFYGTTNAGGCNSSCNYSPGYGTIFRLSASGGEQIVHRFTYSPDGAYPSGRLLFEKKKLYGTTFGGGADLHGTVFSADSKGVKILYSFGGTPDGSIPWGLTKGSKNSLYGTTQAGGSGGSSGGVGTIFSFSP